MTPTGVTPTTPLTRGRMTGRTLGQGGGTAPGVTVEWVGPLFRELTSLRSDVAGLVGLAVRGPVGHATRLTSASEYESLYGPPADGMLLAPAVHGFFANGGTTCWVVRAVHRETAASAEGGTGTGLHFRARSPGTWADGTTVDLRPVGGGLVAVALRAPDGRTELWRNLGLADLLDHFSDVTGSDRSASALASVTLEDGARLPSRATRVVLTGGHDGLTDLTPAHLAGDEAMLSASLPHGATLLAGVEEVTQVGVPDLVIREPGNSLGLPNHSPSAIAAAQAGLVAACEAHQRTALLHHPDPEARADQVVAWRRSVVSAYAALYWPWLRVPDPSRPRQLRDVPPDGHVAGIVARSDLAAGPHKPPANEVVGAAVGLTRPVAEEDHALANDGAVNVVRSVPGRGVRVLGARTTSDQGEWRYLNVRRLVTQVQRSVAARAAWLVFEPHDRSLRDDVERVVRQFLDELWRSGGLDGATAEDAYSVRVRDADPLAGVPGTALVVDIGLQPPWPAEFVVVRIDVPELGTTGTADGGEGRGEDR